MSDVKYLIAKGEMLTDARKGIYTVTYFWSDKTITTEKVCKGPIIIPIFYPGLYVE